MDTQEVLEIFNKMSNEDIAYFVALSHERVYYFDGEHTRKLDMENPAVLNGNSIQVNLGEPTAI